MIEQGQAPPEGTIKLIQGEERVWVRVAATRNEAEWHESLMEVTSGVAPPRWIPQRWEYDEALFISSEVCGAEVAGWLRANLVNVDGVDIKLPIVQPGQLLQWWQYSSGSTTDTVATIAAVAQVSAAVFTGVMARRTLRPPTPPERPASVPSSPWRWRRCTPRGLRQKRWTTAALPGPSSWGLAKIGKTPNLRPVHASRKAAQGGARRHAGPLSCAPPTHRRPTGAAVGAQEPPRRRGRLLPPLAAP